MGLLEFNKLPINTLVGADWKTFKDITGGRDIGAAYKGKYRLTKAVCRLLSTLAPLQDRRYEKLLADKPLEHDPVFILGHWRSGTTFLLRQAFRLQHDIPDCISASYDVGAAFLQEEHELVDAGQTSHGQYGTCR